MYDNIIHENEHLFNEFKKLSLNKGKYAITASGPMGIRGLRKMNDIDILLTDDYWNEMIKTHKEFEEDGFKKIKLSKNVEAVYSGSFSFTAVGYPTVAEQIEKAETINDMQFVSLEHVKFFKSKSSREKDAKDIILIQEWEDLHR